MDGQEECKKSLSLSALFKEVGSEEMARICAAARRVTVAQGRYVYRQGESDRHFYVVAEGEAELTMSVADGGQVLVSHVGPRGHFGETALLTKSSNGLSVRALTDLSLLSFDADTFEKLLENPAIQRQLSIALARRLRVSFHDHANALVNAKAKPRSSERFLDQTFLTDPALSKKPSPTPSMADRHDQPVDSTIARQIMTAVRRFGAGLDPVLITGENGTGRRMAAYEIHRGSPCGNGPYLEVDVRNFEPGQLEVELFGYARDSFSFSPIDQLGVFERLQNGTVVLYNAENMEPDFQRTLAGVIKKGAYTKVAGVSRMTLRCRIILICKDTSGQQDGHSRLLPSLYALVADHHFRMTPLRGHRRDIPRLVTYYLKRYSLQYGKNITRVDDQTLGKFMNYDWPGNLTEMASVLQRAVILGKNNEPVSSQLLLGVPKSEGKWEFNLLRLSWIRAFLGSRLFPALPRAVVGICLVLVVITLFFGPAEPEQNIGLTLGWVVGWPLLIFSFFFLARTWCSVCGLSVPGALAQALARPERPTPPFLRKYSGWIMASLCILLFWIETTWNAYQSPHLTGWIITAIATSALVFSVLFKRRVWCRYLCPLGAINAVFSMPAVLELRSNTHVCINRCTDHVCYTGDGGNAGCPMFRHPFLVDNNRDCILCGQCIKNCKLESIHLNLRLAPQELWNLQSPRLEDGFLIVSLAAIFYPFVLHQNFPGFFDYWRQGLHGMGLPENQALAASIFFFSCILIHLGGYSLLSGLMARLTGNSLRATASILGYGMIPLILGAYLAAHLEVFVGGAGLLAANLMAMAGFDGPYGSHRIMSRDAAFVLQAITVAGGLLATLYASHRIVNRLTTARPRTLQPFVMLASFYCITAVVYLLLL